jgi:hypothetical protein
MKKAILLLSILIMVLIQSCESDSVISDNGNIYGIINGKVLNVNLEPIEGAEVFTIPPTETIFSGIEGDFTFSKVPEGNYKIYAKKANYPIKFVTVGVLKNKSSRAMIMLTPNSTSNGDIPKPFLIAPANNSSTEENPLLKWEFYKPDESTYTYVVYFDDKPSPIQIVAAEIEANQFQIHSLQPENTYYWKIGVSNSEGDYNESETWSIIIP